MKAQLGDEFADFERALGEKPPVSLRVNPAKTFAVPPEWEAIPWFRGGFYLPERPLFTADPLFHAGAYYVQEASGMLLGQAVGSDRPLLTLDLCAAPGGKSALLASVLPAGSVLVANEAIASRAGILKENLTRWGEANVIVTQNDPADFAPLTETFDLIVIDAPCSGEGLWRKDANAANEWSAEATAFCAARQKRILSDILPCLRPGGRLVYATCTFAPEENAEAVDFILQNFPETFQPVALNLPQAWGFTRISTRLGGEGWQGYPHKTRGEGFFMAVLQKNGLPEDAPMETPPPAKNKNKGKRPEAAPKNAPAPEKVLSQWLSAEALENHQIETRGEQILLHTAAGWAALQALRNSLRIIKGGVLLGETKGKDFAPSHEFALSGLVSPAVPRWEADLKTAQAFLKKDVFALPEDTPNGWLLITYQNQNLGWVKKIGHRFNNYLPTGWRIRMDLES